MTVTVAVCALTYRRPEGLRELLEGLAALEPPDADVKIVIVENDPSGPSEGIVDAFRERVRWPLEFATEASRGIPFARNRAIEVAGEVDFIVFIDDDEIPDRRWLGELLQVQRATGAPVVVGPVIPVHPAGTPDWVVRGGFFQRKRYPTGHEMSYGWTSNVLIDRQILVDDRRPFNETFGLNGGDDTHFFERARLRGQRMVWADEALVTERVPPTRATGRWLLQREYRRGNTISLCLLDFDNSRVRRVRRAVRAALHVAEGVIHALAGTAKGRAGVVAGLQRVAFGAGLFTGLFGLKYDEYRDVHGT